MATVVDIAAQKVCCFTQKSHVDEARLAVAHIATDIDKLIISNNKNLNE